MADLSKSQIDKLGERIRDADAISADDLALLQQVRAAHDDAMREVADTLAAELGVQPASRLKTVGTIVDKLRRERMRLTQMQDIAGGPCRGRHGPDRPGRHGRTHLLAVR